MRRPRVVILPIHRPRSSVPKGRMDMLYGAVEHRRGVARELEITKSVGSSASGGNGYGKEGCAAPPSVWGEEEGGRERKREEERESERGRLRERWQLLRWTLLSDYVKAAIERGRVTGTGGRKRWFCRTTNRPTIKRIV